MATKGIVGTVAGIWRFPVKSMQGEQLAQADLTGRGFVGDRAYALIDADTGKVVSAKSARLFPDILDCRAVFVVPPQSCDDVPPVRITLPNGVSVTSDSSDADRVLSAYFRRNVTLARVAPENFTIDQYYPDLPDLDPSGRRDTVVSQKVGAAYFAQAGRVSPVPVGSFFDGYPVSVVTTASLDHLSAVQPQSRFDERRFRMNVIVGDSGAGFVENEWIGRDLAIGDAARLSIAVPTPRCVMTTLAQDELPKDIDILRILTRHNRVQIGRAGLFPCVGVYATVGAPGTIRTGDRVAVS